MADIQRTRGIAARPQEVWDVLADFGSISSWADNVDHSCILFCGPGGGPVGTARRVQVGRDALVERITEFDAPRALAYDIEGLPRRLRRVTNRWTVDPGAGDSAVVTLTSTVGIGPHPLQRLAERALCRYLARQSGVMLAGLANRLEQARV
ncbi:MxaD family protein [Mycobacterium saskatchewanense]|uniref:Cyclase n=1 Tax=Mycobacterium saskatchewanense TaxID=220927 RepID=A0AAJ3TVI2_9MYCO|nr:SRPBCC family protein [Mycobacterium saskatchewanense]ORW68751.1 cyclase [Mycobacterium saskatchewanense]BBX62291.1 MxaD family protein [Mycobacterium saskatchewanense]